MNLVGKVPVEPLDDERLTNIERKLVVHVSEMSQQRQVRAPRRLFAFAAVALAVVVAGFVGWKIRDDGTPVVGARPEQLAMTRGALDLGDAQITGTDFAVTRTANRVDIEMKPGKLDLHVEHKPERLFVVRAGAVEIEDVGTRFTVDYDGKNVDVRVTEGEVKVKHAGKEFAVTANNAWTIELGPITIATLDERQAQVAATDKASMQDPTENVVAVAPTANGNGNGNGDGNGNGGSSGSNGGGAQGSGARSKAGGPNAKKALERWPYEPLVKTSASDPKRAIDEYVELFKTMPEGEDRDEVLYSIAVMYHRAKDDTAARHTIKGVLARRGGTSPAYKAALWLDLRIQCLGSYAREKLFNDDCRRAAEKYVVKFPNGHEAGIAQEVLSEISRGQ